MYSSMSKVVSQERDGHSPQPSTFKQVNCDLACSLVYFPLSIKESMNGPRVFPQETCEVLGNVKDFGKSYGSFAIRMYLFWYLGTPSLVQLLQCYWLLKTTQKKKKGKKGRKRHN